MQTLWNYLVAENPMSQEAVRAGRRFLRTGGETGRVVNYTAIGLILFMYLWLMLAILRYREDMTLELQCFELGLLTLVVPASLFGAVSSEREKLTWDSLIMTRLTPVQIIAGKLLWRLLLIVGLMTLFLLPMLLCHVVIGRMCQGASCNMGDSMTLHETLGTVFGVQVAIFSWSLMVAGLTFFASSKSRRPINTLSIVTVVLLAFLILVPCLVAMFGGDPWWPQYTSTPLRIVGSFLIQVNPFFNTVALTGTQTFPSDDLWHIVGIAPFVPVLYLLSGTLFFYGSLRALRGLEAAKRTIG